MRGDNLYEWFNIISQAKLSWGDISQSFESLEWSKESIIELMIAEASTLYVMALSEIWLLLMTEKLVTSCLQLSSEIMLGMSFPLVTTY